MTSEIFNKDGFITVPNVNLIPEFAYNGSLGIAKSFFIRKEKPKAKVEWLWNFVIT